MARLALLLLPLALMACSSTDPARLVVGSQTSEARISTHARSVEIKEVSLPDYAKGEDIAVQGEDGAVLPLQGVIWADDPERAMTGALVRNLMAITRAQVAAAPWPLRSFPDAELTVRVEQMLVQNDNRLSLRGQYAISPEVGRGRIKPFVVSVPIAETDRAGIATAHSAAWRQLAEIVAKDL